MTDAAVRVEALEKVFDAPEHPASGGETLVAATRWLWRCGLRNYTGASA
jgi:hypothetical protein